MKHLLNSTKIHFSLLLAGSKVWAFKAYTPVQGYPKQLSSFGLPRGVKKIDAALYDVESGKTLFFVGDDYFRCD